MCCLHVSRARSSSSGGVSIPGGVQEPWRRAGTMAVSMVGFWVGRGVSEVLPCLQLVGAALGDALCLFSRTLTVCVPDLCCSEQQLCSETRLTGVNL